VESQNGRECEGTAQPRSSDVRHEVEHEEEDLVHTEKAVHHNGEGLSRYGEPTALRAVDKIRRTYAKDEPEDHQGNVDDRTPHEEMRERVDVHEGAPFSIGSPSENWAARTQRQS
jgi:hypothetical protein